MISGRPMDEGTWSTVLGALQESTIPRWSLYCNNIEILAFGNLGEKKIVVFNY
jgi:hypothetical protein